MSNIVSIFQCNYCPLTSTFTFSFVHWNWHISGGIWILSKQIIFTYDSYYAISVLLGSFLYWEAHLRFFYYYLDLLSRQNFIRIVMLIRFWYYNPSTQLNIQPVHVDRCGQCCWEDCTEDMGLAIRQKRYYLVLYLCTYGHLLGDDISLVKEGFFPHI